MRNSKNNAQKCQSPKLQFLQPSSFKMPQLATQTMQQCNSSVKKNKRLFYLTETRGARTEEAKTATAGRKLWNSSPAHQRQAGLDYDQFQQLLKTFLFGS